MDLLDEDDDQYSDEWMEEITFNIDDCCSDINDYIISRKADPPSETISKASFVEEYIHKSVHEEMSFESISDLANQLDSQV